jgi:hypothetical protein
MKKDEKKTEPNEEIPAHKKIKALKIVHDHLVKKATYQDKVNAAIKLHKLVKKATEDKGKKAEE